MQTVIEVRRIDLWALFKVTFFVYAVLGLFGGFFYLFFMMLATGIGGAFIEEEIPSIGILGGVFGIVMLPVLAFLYGAIGSVFATICAAIINLIMKATGGVKFDVDFYPVSGMVQTPVGAAPVTAPAPPRPTPPPDYGGPAGPEGPGPQA